MKQITSENSPIRVGLIGLGRAGWDIHAKQFHADPRFRVVEVMDPESARCAEAEEKLGCRAFSSRDEMLERGEADLVVVSSPNLAHREDALAVCEAGKHCVIEKPMAATYREAVQIVGAFAGSGLHVFPHHQYLFSKEFQLLKGVIDSGKLGEVFEIRYNWAAYVRRNDWQTLRRNAGGLWNNHGAHILSMLLPLLGARVRSLAGETRHIKDAGDADDHATFLLTAENDRLGAILLSTCCPVPMPRVLVLGSCGCAYQPPGSTEVRLKFFDPEMVSSLTVQDGAARNRVYGTRETLPWREEGIPLDSLDAPSSFVDDVASVLLHGTKPAATPESAVEMVRILQWGLEGDDPATEAKTTSAAEGKVQLTSLVA